MGVTAALAASGGHVRVGPRGSLWLGPGRLATSNAEQVEAATALLAPLGCRPATPPEARGMLGHGLGHGAAG